MSTENKWLTPRELAKLKTNPHACADKLRKIAKDVAKHPDEFVLVIERHEEMNGCPGIIAPRYIPDEFYSLREDYTLGIIGKNGEVKINKQLFSLQLPTERYVRWTDGFRGDPRLTEGELTAGLSVMSLLYLDQPCKARDRFDFGLLKTKLALEIRVGDQAVEEWFSLPGEEDELFLDPQRAEYVRIFRALCKVLGRPNRAMQMELAEQRARDQRALTLKLDAYMRLIEADLKEAERLGIGNTSIVRLWKKILELTPELMIDALKK